jgi:hypothetical protein
VGWWILRRSAWVAIWAVASFGYFTLSAWAREAVARTFDPLVPVPPFGHLSMAGLSLVAYAIVLLPLVLRATEEVSSRSLAELIGGVDADERPGVGRLLLRESLLGGGLGLGTGLLAFGYAALVRGGAEGLVPLALGLATGVAVLLAVLASAALGETALRRSAAGKRVSGAGLPFVAMLIGAVLYLVLAYWAGILSLPIG